MSAIELRGLDHVVLRVAEVDRALAFYCGVLGCTEERRIEELGLIQLRAGVSLIDLVAIDSPLGRAGGGAVENEARNVDHFALELASFDEGAIRKQLEAHGIDSGDARRRYGAKGFGLSIYLNDPDGNTVELKGPPSTDPEASSDLGSSTDSDKVR
jgi:glyoxylase I family protein